jgi:hypothetical protein
MLNRGAYMKKKARAWIVALAMAAGFVVGVFVVGAVTLWIWVTLVRHIPAGIHSDWASVTMIGAFLCSVLGGLAGSIAAARLALSLRN